jgi:integrase
MPVADKQSSSRKSVPGAPAPTDNGLLNRGRRLHLGHFAFMRAVLQGLDTRDSWNRYLRVEGEHDDRRNVSRTIAWIRDEFAAAARRSERFGIARLVKIDADRIADIASTVPTLAEFAADHGLLDFSESEQLEQYVARYGVASRRQARRRRLIARQLDALNWLERQVVRPPQADDAAAAWLHPDLARHLEAAGIVTLRQLIDRINGLGMRWWSGIRAIGVGKAQRIMDWLRSHEATLGIAIGAHVQVKRTELSHQDLRCVVPKATAIVPLDKLMVPPGLDGSAGLYRAPRGACLLDANTDLEAVLAWLKAKQGLTTDETAELKRQRGVDPAAPEGPMDWLNYLSHTQRAYRKEAERFLLWAIVQRKVPLSSMTADDCDAYRAFLANPTPADRWCGPRGREKWGPLWRPFEGPLSLQAQRQAITILKNLYTFLVDHCYLIASPWNTIVLPKGPRARTRHERDFTLAQWAFIRQRLGRLPATSANQRLRLALLLFHATGLRPAEAVAARTDHLRPVGGPTRGGEGMPGTGWTLSVLGKGEKKWEVPVSAELMAELSQYLMARGLDPDPAHPSNRGVYLLGKAVDVAERAPWSPPSTLAADPKAGIAAQTLYAQLKDFFAECLAELEGNDAHDGHWLAKAGIFWLRQMQDRQEPGANM